MKLYRSKFYPNRWYAYSTSTGWVMFPAEAGGWEKRTAARGVDPMYIQEMPLGLASETGIPTGPAAPDFLEAA
jgi:hypothetical protein